MKKYLLLLISLAFLTGCSLKQNVESNANEKSKEFTAEEYASNIQESKKGTLPLKIKSATKDGQEVEYTLFSFNRLKHRLLVASEMKVKPESKEKEYKTLEYYAKASQSFFYHEFCVENEEARAGLNNGVEILFMHKIADKAVPIFLNKKLCDDFHPLK